MTYTTTVVFLLGVLSSVAVYGQQVYGKIGEKYAALRGAGGPLGAATNNELPADFNGRYNSFQNGFIYFHRDIGTAYGVWGAIGVKWNQLGRVGFGYPITDESIPADGRGRYNHFRAIHVPHKPEASIYWTPQVGAFAVYGEIRKAWAAAGWERSIGYPTSDEFQWGKYRRSNFEQGYITWAPGEGARIVRSGEAITRQLPPNTFGTLLVTGVEYALEGKPVRGNSTFLSENTICAEYEARRGEIGEAVKNQLRALANPQMAPLSVHSNAVMEMNPACSARADVVSNGDSQIRVRWFIPGNNFRFRVTSPSILSGSLDPAFTATIDIWAERVITFRGSTFTASPVKVTPRMVKVDSRNVTGDLFVAVTKVDKVIASGAFADALMKAGTFDSKALDSGLNGMAPASVPIPPQYRIEYSVAPGHQFRVNATARPLPPVSRLN